MLNNRQNWKRSGNAGFLIESAKWTLSPYAIESIIKTVVGAARFELATPCSQSRRPNEPLQSVNGFGFHLTPKTNAKHTKNNTGFWKPVFDFLGEYFMTDFKHIYSFAASLSLDGGLTP